MAALYDLMPQVTPFLVDCPEGVQAWALRQALCAFYTDSLVYRDTLTLTATGDTALFPLGDFATIPTGCFVHAGLALHVDGVEKDESLWAILNNVLVLQVEPKAGAALSLEVALGSGGAVTTVPDDLYLRYGSAIADQALFLIQSQPRRPYSDRDGAMQALSRYQGKLHDARVTIETDGKKGREAFINPVPDYF